MLVTLDLLSLNKGLGFLLDDLDMTEIIFACDLRYYGTGDFLLKPGAEEMRCSISVRRWVPGSYKKDCEKSVSESCLAENLCCILWSPERLHVQVEREQSMYYQTTHKHGTDADIC